jgi:hypothetical protein
VLDRTRRLWAKQDQHVGDRQRLFSAVAEAVAVETALYPGCYVDLAPSYVWPDVTYVDVDKRAKPFFGDHDGIDELIVEHGADPDRHAVQFVQADYTQDLDLPAAAFDLLISLYPGFVSEHCTRHLRVGGHLLANPSHGDVAMTSIDPRYRLSGVVVSLDGDYVTQREELGTYLVPKRDLEITVEMLHQSGRGVPYTRSPFAYLFERAA